MGYEEWKNKTPCFMKHKQTLKQKNPKETNMI